ncbi:uncharacterized protein BO88DRAFT_353284 [Aspergillus vadensis CBS 113365]|uniref:Uncharacterized protein n=1 Tax=Aspergillus vadensis (strain CBS 113365 / IMI 142717 / IBT 24658) TaxID=1448311 RepID=A0A319AZV3_ASPVC|nr:hypothetical protein BO88DRAFT_353284 [Aspergillus vadensis CBS 113365]PYH63430.1 hypothetical protein BO88DRAFT_353284 [Aspergillus vadensis CBS 113365]
MYFWVGWALWQKLSFTQKYATAEARQKAEMQPMLAEPSEIPFGARALEKGIQVEGIWTPDCRSARQSTTHSGSRPESIASAPKPTLMALTGDDIQGLERTYQPAPSPSLYDQCNSPKVLDIEYGQSEYISLSPTNQSLQLDGPISIEPECPPDLDKRRSRWFGARSSWVKKPFDSYKRRSTPEGLRRTSSESFRRRISKIIDENIRTNPAEIYQLRAINQETLEGRRTPSPTRSQGFSNDVL